MQRKKLEDIIRKGFFRLAFVTASTVSLGPSCPILPPDIYWPSADEAQDFLEAGQGLVGFIEEVSRPGEVVSEERVPNSAGEEVVINTYEDTVNAISSEAISWDDYPVDPNILRLSGVKSSYGLNNVGLIFPSLSNYDGFNITNAQLVLFLNTSYEQSSNPMESELGGILEGDPKSILLSNPSTYVHQGNGSSQQMVYDITDQRIEVDGQTYDFMGYWINNPDIIRGIVIGAGSTQDDNGSYRHIYSHQTSNPPYLYLKYRDKPSAINLKE